MRDTIYRPELAMSPQAEIQEIMNMLRRLKGAIHGGADAEELDSDVEDIMDKLFETMKSMAD